MSRTDKTKPWWVRIAEHHTWEVHNHTTGICTLPETRYEPRHDWWQGCHYSDWPLCYKGNCCYGCGCRLCTSYYYRREERRRSRHQAKRQNRALLKEANST